MPRWLPLLLGFIQAVGPISTDMYLPAFPAIERGFGTAAGSAQLTLAAWFAGLALGQIGQGALADRYGRRAPLLAGTAVYTMASAGCALSGGIGVLAAFRCLAALGAGASMVVPRAVVRDFADGAAAARLMGQLMLVMGAAPILAPTLGGALLAVTGWRAIFWVGTGYGVVSMLLVWALLPETLPRAARIGVSPRAVAARLGLVLRERGFAVHVTMVGGMGFALFAYLAGSPHVFITRYHVAPPVYGMVFGANAFAFIAATQVNALVVPRLGLDRVLRASSLAFLLGTIVLAGLGLLDLASPWPLGLGLAFCLAMMGFIGPCAQAGALSAHSSRAGSASALLGTIQFSLGAVSGALMGKLSGGTALPMALVMLAGGLAVKGADLKRRSSGRVF